MQLKLQQFFLCLGLTILTALPNPEWTFASEKDLNYLMRAATVRVSRSTSGMAPGRNTRFLKSFREAPYIICLNHAGLGQGYHRTRFDRMDVSEHLKPEHSRRIFPEKDVFQVLGSEPFELSQETPFRFALVNVSGLNVRSGPSTRYEILDILSEGQQIHLLVRKNRWVKIRLMKPWKAGLQEILEPDVADPESKPVHELQIRDTAHHWKRESFPTWKISTEADVSNGRHPLDGCPGSRAENCLSRSGRGVGLNLRA